HSSPHTVGLPRQNTNPKPVHHPPCVITLHVSVRRFSKKSKTSPASKYRHPVRRLVGARSCPVSSSRLTVVVLTPSTTATSPVKNRHDRSVSIRTSRVSIIGHLSSMWIPAYWRITVSTTSATRPGSPKHGSCPGDIQ